MAVTINGQHGTYTNILDTFPQSTALTGTVTITNGSRIVTGSSTAFGDELQNNEWLFDTTNKKLYKIARVVSDTELILQDEASAGSTSVKRTPRQTYSLVSWKIDSTNAASIDNIAFEADNSGSISIDPVSRVRPNPIIIDSTANSNTVYVEFKA